MTERCRKLEDGEDKEAKVRQEDDENDDVDFNPYLKETPSPEASSSLSYAIEGLNDVNVHDNGEANSFRPVTTCQEFDAGELDHGEEGTVMQSNGPLEQQTSVSGRFHKRKSDSISQSKIGNQGRSSSVSEGIDGVVVESNNVTRFTNDPSNLHVEEEEDAICRRTRARYSLANFTLDELETFLQETDDEDDVQNVDDQEEYRKFLAAVLHCVDGDFQSAQENGNGDDEDEDSDADFEIELEEALESDSEEAIREKTQGMLHGVGRRPETRQNRRQKTSAQYKNKLSDQAKRPLRPILPMLCNGLPGPIPTPSGNNWPMENMGQVLNQCSVADGFINGFSPHQIGQLYCLIHEHVQLLIQIFSLCVLDPSPSRQQIASQVQGLICEMLLKREEAMACRRKPYPDFYLRPPYVHPSVPETSLILPENCSPEKLISDADDVCPQPNILSQTISPSSYSWMPCINGHVSSVLDVAPLNSVRRYMDDVQGAVQDYRQRHVENTSNACNGKEPLFPLCYFPSVTEVSAEFSKGSSTPSSDTPPSPADQQRPRKSLAATLVEKTKKQSVAAVPKEISKIAQRFLPIFNPALFPRKPPPSAVTSRLLFTEIEDELLALGLMEYNSDWKAIQQRFLPCKSKHQIFVRQKNRCSSKAPENPIKAVRRMKTSQLTAAEMQRIQEGLKIFKMDWFSVWKFIVPHRDPSLLHRQWRTALGIQKSYKQDSAQKEKRRLYDSQRRRLKAADVAKWPSASDKEDSQAEVGERNCSENGYANAPCEPYFHGVCLADWRPDTSKRIADHPCSNEAQVEEGVRFGEEPNSREHGPLNYPMHPHTIYHSGVNVVQPGKAIPNMDLNCPRPQICLHPRRLDKADSSLIVKLAPDLPPVNLPPSVRVISNSTLKFNQSGMRAMVPAVASSVTGIESGNKTAKSTANYSSEAGRKSATNHSSEAGRNTSDAVEENVTTSCAEEPGFVNHTSLVDEGTMDSDVQMHPGFVNKTSLVDEGTMDSDLQMHPLLFQTPEDGQVPYYPSDSRNGAASPFSFFSENHPQLNLSLLCNPQRLNNIVGSVHKSACERESLSASSGIDFHPLLQRTDDANGELVSTLPIASLSVGLEGRSSELRDSSIDVQVEPHSHIPLLASSQNSSPKGNELDLEIHLSSSTRESNVINVNPTATEPLARSSIGTLAEIRNVSSPSRDNLASHAKTINMCMDDAMDPSRMEIVMEQEELSDSDDEEIEEHVEFECEEMADSEGEESHGCDQSDDLQHKDSSLSGTEMVMADTDVLQMNSKPPHSHGYSGRKSKKDRSTLWLSLDPSAEQDKPHVRQKNRLSTNRRVLANRKSASQCRNKSSTQKAAPPDAEGLSLTGREHDVEDMTERLSLGPLSFPLTRKPRRRARIQV